MFQELSVVSYVAQIKRVEHHLLKDLSLLLSQIDDLYWITVADESLRPKSSLSLWTTGNRECSWFHIWVENSVLIYFNYRTSISMTSWLHLYQRLNKILWLYLLRNSQFQFDTTARISSNALLKKSEIFVCFNFIKFQQIRVLYGSYLILKYIHSMVVVKVQSNNIFWWTFSPHNFLSFSRRNILWLPDI